MNPELTAALAKARRRAALCARGREAIRSAIAVDAITGFDHIAFAAYPPAAAASVVQFVLRAAGRVS